MSAVESLGTVEDIDLRLLLKALTGLGAGEFTTRLPDHWEGLPGKIAAAFNETAERHQQLVGELERLSRVVGREGRIHERASLGAPSGAWGASIDAINQLIGDLVQPTVETARVIGAVAKGDLSQSMALEVDDRPLAGEFLRTAKIVNRMVDQLGSFASEVTRVAREVGTEGKLGGQAQVKAVAGTWKDLTDNVNLMAGNLTGQVRNIAAVTTAVATGDLTKKITVDVRGEFLELKDTINTMVDQLRSFASEVTRVAREVGTEGKLGGQARVEGVSGTWKDLTDNVNSMAGNLTSQVRNIAAVTTAVAKGDLSKKITVDVKGEILELKNTVNTMVDQLSSFAAEVTRVAREVGTEGKLGGQAEVKGVAGTWKDLTDSVNFMASNLTSQVRNIAEVTTAVANGDLSKKITVDVRGEILELKDTINTMVDQLRSFAAEVTRVAREVGTEGKLGGQANVRDVAGTWKDLTDSVNSMAGNLTAQVRNIAEVTTAVANGDLSKKITVDVKGEILELKDTINTMVDQLRSFAAEVTRVAREVGTEGKLGGQAEVRGVSGTWKDLTDNVNFMAGNLTSQVRGIAKVVTAVANGDLKQKLTLEAKGEIAELADTINSMIATLATFAAQVTTVAREVGVEGQLGGQANVPGAAGTWKDLTDNVNQLAANLTTQVRAIAEVATAVTKGDLTQSITVAASGEVASLKDNINEMIVNLKNTTQKNSEQDWLKTNLAKFSRMLQGQKDLLAVGRLILSELAPVVSAQHALFYTVDAASSPPQLALLASYAFRDPIELGSRLAWGQGLIGQCAQDQQKIVLSPVPQGYVKIASGLGDAPPQSVLILPVLFEGRVKGVLELASLDRFSPIHEAFLDELTESIGIVLNTIEANMRTEGLLSQSQSLASELQNRQEELQQTNGELQEKARLLAHQNAEVERKNQEVEQARQALEEKATQLALTSKYKSEFLANMSHELRTPLNSLLILSDQLARNPDGNLSNRQTEFAKTIHASGNDLLTLINDILDLSKIESGTVVLDIDDVRFGDLRRYVERTFSHVAEAKGVEFDITLDPELPDSMITDGKRFRQIIKNLLSNAFKFTHHGRVALSIEVAQYGWDFTIERLQNADMVIAISVSDTGIGISPDKQQIIFEAFQQADGSTSRRFGGTGLGLAISREIARLLGGGIRLQSTPGQGSTFTLYVPQRYVAPTTLRRPIEEPPAKEPQTPTLLEPLAPPATLADLERDIKGDLRPLQPTDRMMLIVENDESFATFLTEVAREHGFHAVATSSGVSAVALVHEHLPSAITLDLRLPDIDGWRVLDRLKSDLATRHIPVCVISSDDEALRARALGAHSVIVKPIERRDLLDSVLYRLEHALEWPTQRVIVTGGDAEERAAVAQLLELESVHVVDAPNLTQFQKTLQRGADCIIACDADEETHEKIAAAIETAEDLRDVPLIVIDEKVTTPNPHGVWKRLSERAVVLHVQSKERLLDQVLLQLHVRMAGLSETQRTMLTQLHNNAGALAGKTALVVDDDVRNIFALTSVLERQEMHVLSAETGRDAIRVLEQTPNVDIMLLDIMMPEMDGIDTMKAIRKFPRFASLPIVAVTAKAMKGDREKCIEAGAWDYLSKPVDIEQLFSVLRFWCRR
jgi:signal transduction histidine kinase/HAMP domain-containing protein/CheY-like chemotaxis protein